ncbi:MAG TPA: hypothetical protein PLB89_02055 [Flavobacteriales bacterium]|nr:hypothetical protein [Flavobacteriales bacterium]
MLSLSMSGQAQSPGGVSTGLTVWYKANLSVSGTTPITAWNTSGGSAAGFNLTPTSAATSPNLIAGSTNYKRYNYNPRIDFTASSFTRLQNTGTSPDLYGTTGSLFMVTDQNSGVGQGTALTYSSNTSTQRLQFKPSFRIQTSTGVNGYTGDWSAPSEYAITSASLLSVTGLGATAVHRRNSVSFGCSNCNLPLYNPAVTTGLRVGRNASGGGSEYVDCDMGEIIIYNSALSAAEVARVESYLALKYGITRGGNSGTGASYNYVNSSGATIWDKTANAGYNNDIAGIGRDDGSALVQRQSISVNNNESVSIGLVSIDASNTANTNNFTSNNSFVMWGNNGAAQNTVFNDPACFTNMPSGVQAKILRNWKAQVTNFSQTVTIAFETSSIVAYTPLTNLRLLVDNDGSNWSNATVISGAVLDGTRVEFAGVTLSAASPYFTLGTANFQSTPLPIEMLFFTAAPEGSGGVQLTWATASETDNDRFEVQRSVDGVEFGTIGQLDGSGSSSTRNDYAFFDGSAYPGTSYYRLVQVDADGTFEYSEVRAVTLGKERSVTVYPNPARDVVRIAGLENGSGAAAVEVFNESGGRVPFPMDALEHGMLNVGTLARGIYLVRIGEQVARVVKE